MLLSALDAGNQQVLTVTELTASHFAHGFSPMPSTPSFKVNTRVFNPKENGLLKGTVGFLVNEGK